MLICETCHAGCCRNFAIGLTGYDILNIHTTLKVDYSSFIQIIPVQNEEDIKYQAKYAALFRFSDCETGIYYRFSMRMSKSPIITDTIKCIFLMEWLNEPLNPSNDKINSKCGIYNCRPLICSTFPSKFDMTGKQGIIFNVNSSNLNQGNPIYNQCPRKITEQDIADSKDQIMKNLIMRKYEGDYFQNLSDYWNQKPGTIKEFFAFIKNVYQNRIVIEA